MTDIIIVPGFGGSGPDHWQSIWEEANPNAHRIRPSSWDEPELSDWVAALESAVSESATPPVLVAHSLGCLLIAFWQWTSLRPVAGAFLVAVPDPETPGFDEITPSFKKVPTSPFLFPSVVVSSTNDPYDAKGYGAVKAGQWGSDFWSIGDAGHINDQSGLGEWPSGQKLLESFLTQIIRPKPLS